MHPEGGKWVRNPPGILQVAIGFLRNSNTDLRENVMRTAHPPHPLLMEFFWICAWIQTYLVTKPEDGFYHNVEAHMDLHM